MRCAIHRLSPLLATAFAATAATAQWQFAELPRGHVPALPDPAHSVAVGDVDADGDVDLAVGTPGQCRLLLGDGHGRFVDATVGRLPQRLQYCLDVALFDADSDGDLDLFCLNYQQDWLYRNDGTGTFTDATASTLPVDTTNERRIVAVDLDGDGDRDLVANPLMSNTPPLRIWRNQGGTFVDGSAAALPGITGMIGTVVPVDVDGDGDADLVAAGVTNRLLRNNGGGVFADVSAQLPASYAWCTAVAALDADGDTDQDLVFACDGQHRLCHNDGTGVFTDATALLPVGNGPAPVIAAFDADGDGDRDLLFACRGPDRFYRNDLGTFSDQSGALPGDVDAGHLRIADIDQDNDLDVVLAGEIDLFAMRQPLHVWLNDGGGVFHDGSARPLASGEEHAAAVADIDGDGDLDLLVGRDDNRPSQLFVNDGSGTFTDRTATQLPSGNDRVRDAAFGDIDGDGDADLLLACVGADRLWRNDGTGTFADVSAAQLPPDSVPTEAVVLVDVDGDGDRDVVTAGTGHHRLLRNTNGVFVDVTATQTPPATLTTTDVAAGDIDGDGDVDLVFAGDPAQLALWRNGGTGTFADVTGTQLVLGLGAITRSVALVDVDGDGDPDLVVGAAGQNRLCVNDGTGRFVEDTLLRLPLDNDDTGSVVAGDVDDDGDADLVFGNVYWSSLNQLGCNRLCINDGTGHFVDETLLRLESNYYPFGGRSLALGDADGDGDLDLFGARGLFVNRLRQLHAPLLLRPGYDWQLDAYARFAPNGTTDVFVPWLSLTRTAIPVPGLGTLGIVPHAPLPALVVPQPAGAASVTWPVPNTPTLVGLQLHVQALQLSFPGGLRLSNVVSDTLVR